MMWRLILSCCMIVWAAPSFAAECTVSFGDWKLKKGDISSVEISPSSQSQDRHDVHYRFTDKIMFSELTRRYLNKPLPVHVGTFAITPVVRGVMHSDAGVFDRLTTKEADEISKELGYCI